jgi:hypothetical protein
MGGFWNCFPVCSPAFDAPIRDGRSKTGEGPLSSCAGDRPQPSRYPVPAGSSPGSSPDSSPVGCCYRVRTYTEPAAAASPSAAVCREAFGERLRCHVALPRWCAGKGSVCVAAEGELNPERGPVLIRGAQGKSPMSSSVSHGSCPIKTRTGRPGLCVRLGYPT